MNSSRRLLELDSLRGIAAVIVLLHRNLLFSGLLAGLFGQLVGASPLQPIRTGRPAVLFFMLSGFVLTRALRGRDTELTVRSWVVWVLQRTIRLCLPVFGCICVSAFLYAWLYDGIWPLEEHWLSTTVWDNPPTAAAITAQSMLIALDGGYSLNSVLWSLVHEWRFSVLLPLILAAPVLSNRGVLLLILIAVALSGFSMGPQGEVTYIGSTLIHTVRATLYFFLPFLLGVALERSDAASLRADRWQTVAGFAAVLGLARVGSDYPVFIASALVIWLALQPGLLRKALRHRVLTRLGTVSFSLYLIHVPLLAALHHGLHGSWSPARICTINLLAALPVAWVFHVVVEKPAHRLARGVSMNLGTKTLKEIHV